MWIDQRGGDHDKARRVTGEDISPTPVACRYGYLILIYVDGNLLDYEEKTLSYENSSDGMPLMFVLRIVSTCLHFIGTN